MTLPERIKVYFDRCIISEYGGAPSEHPITYLNSIKNIIGDNKKNPDDSIVDSLLGTDSDLDNMFG